MARESLLARDRRPAVAEARQVAMYLARELTEHSLPEIGRGIGGRNHTTVLHAVNRIGAAVRTDADLRKAVDNLRRRLGRPGVTADVDATIDNPGFPSPSANPGTCRRVHSPNYFKS